MKIVGLGKAGCNIANVFAKFPQYETHTIDTHSEAEIVIKKRENHEDYDARFPDLKKNLKFTDEEICVITCGSGQISESCDSSTTSKGTKYG